MVNVKPKLLIIAYSSTFHTAPRGIQANRLINNLSNYFDITLVTSKASVPNSKMYFSKSIKYCILPVTNKYLKKLIKEILPISKAFDFWWQFKAYQTILQLVKSQEFSFLLTLSMNLSNFSIGYKLKKSYPHIIVNGFLSDPISFNPYFLRARFWKKIIKNYEAKRIENYDRIIVPSYTMQKEYQRLYPHLTDKIFNIPHSFKRDNKPIHFANKGTNMKVIRYIGTLNTLRSPEPILIHVNEYADFYRRNKISFEFIGSKSIDVKNMFSVFSEIDDIIVSLNPIPYSDVTELSYSSFALLIIDADIKKSPFLPSKLIENLAYGKPIIGLTPSGGESDFVLRQIGMFSLSNTNVDSLIDVIKVLLLKEMNLKVDLIDRFEIDNISKIYADLLLDNPVTKFYDKL